FDFDFDLEAPAEVEANDQETEELVLSPDLDSSGSLDSFDFDNAFPEAGSTSPDNNEPLVEESVSSSKPDELESFDFDLDIPGSESALNIDAGVSDLTDMDELETKIDLAKAYIDMEDFDAAKNIAEEVLEKGNAEQKAEAQAIIDQLK
ncbi:MAG: fimbrial protein FimV, partial [Methylococcales bacterium]|nr:fimbrial protein FimV [Methylococcales bacterium]